ncbi:MAG: hypothetical protein RIR77_1690 [Planctomycetota bacterium]|jgi:hypothetical protein
MRRRQPDPDDLDSLNLLLDTVCNMFGVFIFSALIVAVMAMTRSTQIVVEASPASAQAERAAKVSATDASVRALHARLETIRSSRSSALMDRASEASQLRFQAESELEIREQTLADYKRRLTSDSAFLANLRQEIPRLQDQIAGIEDAIRRARRIKEVETRTPLRRALEGRIPVQVVLHDGRAYILNAWWDHVQTTDHPCDIWCDWNLDAVDAAASGCNVVKCFRGGEIEIHRRILLRTGGGIIADSAEALAKNPAWIRFLSSLDPRRHVVSIRSTATGFQAFGPIRGEIVGRGIPYNVEPTRLDPFYSDSIVEGTPVGQ